MHPDQATDVILDEAFKSKAAVILVPRCALPNRWHFELECYVSKHQNGKMPPSRQDNNYYRWLKHLTIEAKNRKLMLKNAKLPIFGRNIVLYGNFYNK